MYGNNLSGLPAPELLARFFTTPLGQLYGAVPFKQLVETIPKPKGELSGRGCKPWFDVCGGIALQLLKSYYRCSDAKLIEQLNGNPQMQLFCHMQLRENEQVRDLGIVSRWRCYLSRYLDIKRLQLCCAQHWKPWLQHPHMGFQDATVFESYMAFPSDANLLWKSCCHMYEFLQELRKSLHLRKSRIKHDKRKKQYLAFALLKKKGYRKNQKACKALLHYLGRLLKAWEALLQKHPSASLTTFQAARLNTIRAVKAQQEQLYVQGQARVPNKIVSLCKPYIRAIIRGKQAKAVEFGAKVQVLQIDGISFIEHLSYDNFNESTRLKSTVALQEKYFGSCHQLGADRIYATNANRRYCTEQHIATSFIAKGKEGKQSRQKAQMRSVLAKLRGTVLEGSFGNEKNHYSLDKIKARTQPTEKVWIFFSLLTCNAVQMAKRMHPEEQTKRAA